MDKSVTVSGPGANHLAVDGNAQSGAFFINFGKTVTIDGLTVANGNGGGIHAAAATLTVSNCTISGNSGTNSGGGISSLAAGGKSGSSTVTVSNSTVSGNSANYGGGISNGGAYTAVRG